MEKIFISIASYRDPECLKTIQNLLKNAANPENLVFGIHWQRDSKIEKDLEVFFYDERFKFIDTPWQQSKGLCWARAEIQRLYDGEQYFMQIDSHHRFIEDWDFTLKNMLNALPNKKSILTTYGTAYSPNDDENLQMQPYKIVPDKFTPYGTILLRPHYLNDWQHLSEPIPARFVSGHFFFTIGQHCIDYKYDPNIYFAGDEISLSIRSYTMGYDLFHPHIPICWHEYLREYRTKHWDDHNDDNKRKGIVKQAWHTTNAAGLLRLRQMLREEDNGVFLGEFDLGNVRSHREYEIYAGIDFKNKKLTNYAKTGHNPPNPHYDEETWELQFPIENEPKVKLKFFVPFNSIFDSSEKCDFWYLGVIDSQGQEIYRKDLNTAEILLLGRSNLIELEINSDKNPHSVRIWKHFETVAPSINGWDSSWTEIILNEKNKVFSNVDDGTKTLLQKGKQILSSFHNAIAANEKDKKIALNRAKTCNFCLNSKYDPESVISKLGKIFLPAEVFDRELHNEMIDFRCSRKAIDAVGNEHEGCGCLLVPKWYDKIVSCPQKKWIE